MSSNSDSNNLGQDGKATISIETLCDDAVKMFGLFFGYCYLMLLEATYPFHEYVLAIFDIGGDCTQEVLAPLLSTADLGRHGSFVLATGTKLPPSSDFKPLTFITNDFDFVTSKLASVLHFEVVENGMTPELAAAAVFRHCRVGDTVVAVVNVIEAEDNNENDKSNSSAEGDDDAMEKMEGLQIK